MFKDIKLFANTPSLQYSNTPLGVISRRSQFALTPPSVDERSVNSDGLE